MRTQVGNLPGVQCKRSVMEVQKCGETKSATVDKTLTIFHQNIQCLRTSTLELEAHLATLETPQHVLCISEHWMQPEEVLLTKIQGYNMITCFTRMHSIRGGTCIYIKQELEDFEELNIFEEYNIEGHFEMCSVISKNRKTVIFSIYRSCLGDYKLFYQIFEILVRKVFERFKNYIVVYAGDFNINFLTQNNCLNGEDIKNRNMMLDLLRTYNFQQTIHDITRPNKHKKSCIDNVFINSKAFFNNAVIKTGISDHHAQTISIKTGSGLKLEDLYFTGRTFSRGRLCQFQEAFQDCTWAAVLECGDVDKSYNSFITTITYYLNLIFPKKRKKIRTNGSSDWLTTGIKTSIKNKRRMFDFYLSGLVSKTNYKTYTNILKKVIKKAKQLSSKTQIENSENKTKTTWNLINKIMKAPNGKQSIFNHFQEGESPAFLNTVNCFFLNACSATVQNSEDSNGSLVYIKNSFKFKPTGPEEVENVIRRLKNRKSVGIDEIPVSLLKHVAHIISEPLAHIINLSFETGKFPSALKFSIVKPLYKNKGAKNDIKNYRPISLLNNISKIFEKIMHHQITEFLENQRILSDQQNGFRKGKSTTRAIYQTINKIINTLNRRRTAAALCLDLTKAFDSVNHGTMLKKLDACGIRGAELQLIASFLENRWQCTEEVGKDGEKIRSEFGLVTRGVPQGAVLSPLLYILYTNDITNIIQNGNIVLFADDKTVIYENSNIQMTKTNIQDDLNKLGKWFNSNSLTLNINKTQLIHFKPKSTESISIEYGGVELEGQNSVAFLGVTLDSKLNWEAHVDNVAAKLSQFCYALRIIRDTVCLSASLASYHAYVQSRVRYGVIFWGNSAYADRILILQKRCLRTILKINQRESCKENFTKYKIHTVYNIYIQESVNFVMRNPDLFENHKIEHNYDTRQKQNLRTEIPQFSYLQKNVTFNIIKIWNSLPITLRQQPNKKVEQKIGQLLENRSYYSVEEFFADTEKLRFLNVNHSVHDKSL